MLVCTLGDLLLDVVVRLEQPLAAGDDAVAATRAGAGGQAANVAAWAAALGARARFVGKRGADGAGRLIADELAGHGVELAGPAEGRAGVVVSLVGPDGDRSMASDRGCCPDLAPEELDPAWFEGCDWLHVAGYSLVREPIGAAAERAAALARGAGARISADLSSSTVIEAYGAERFGGRLALLEPSVLFATERELCLVRLTNYSGTMVVKRGPEGFTVDGRPYAAAPVEAVDATGAGDALAAGFLVGGPELAREAAARCVSRMGAMP